MQPAQRARKERTAPTHHRIAGAYQWYRQLGPVRVSHTLSHSMTLAVHCTQPINMCTTCAGSNQPVHLHRIAPCTTLCMRPVLYTWATHHMCPRPVAVLLYLHSFHQHGICSRGTTHVLHKDSQRHYKAGTLRPYANTQPTHTPWHGQAQGTTHQQPPPMHTRATQHSNTFPG
jgi:hypothetical protein